MGIFPLSKRFHMLVCVCLICFMTLCWHWFSNREPNAAVLENIENEGTWSFLSDDVLAPRLLPQQLMLRPLASNEDLNYIPKLIHQSWMNDDFPPRMKTWSQSCRAMHQDWQWVFWTDKDNLKMVEAFFPWLLETYRSLPAEINRADAVRNMYMYLFGGVYADLDVECLRPFDKLFRSRDIEGSQAAIFGRMGFDGTDQTLLHTIPNAWMAATAGHPVFLVALEHLRESATAYRKSWFWGPTAEVLSGPVALYHTIEKYEAMLIDGTLAYHIEQNPSYKLFDRPSTEPRVELLPPENIYPYAWNNQGIPHRDLCSAYAHSFDSRKCKEACTTNETYAITYWAHSWSTDLVKTHDKSKLEALYRGMENVQSEHNSAVTTVA